MLIILWTGVLCSEQRKYNRLDGHLLNLEGHQIQDLLRYLQEFN